MRIVHTCLTWVLGVVKRLARPGAGPFAHCG